MAGKIETRLKEIGIELPAPSQPAGTYVPYVLTGNLVFISGQGPVGPKGLEYQGKVGKEHDVDAAKAAARLTMINVLAQLKAACGGDLDRVQRCVKLLGFVNSTPEFDQQPAVINGGSDLLVEVFGDAGRHARSAVSAASLPFQMTVEIEAIFEIA
jgi:enamine deaminase RidA (YjgF/YER057c/UK114 family)